jgi:hypothetical protein
MVALDALFEQALQLPDDQRGTLAVQLLRTLEPDDEEEVTGDEWQAAWSVEIDRRVREVDDGTAELLDGDEVLADARAWLDTQRR